MKKEILSTGIVLKNRIMHSDDILIFSTSITKKQDIKRIEILFAQYPQIHKWSVDFED